MPASGVAMGADPPTGLSDGAGELNSELPAVGSGAGGWAETVPSTAISTCSAVSLAAASEAVNVSWTRGSTPCTASVPNIAPSANDPSPRSASSATNAASASTDAPPSTDASSTGATVSTEASAPRNVSAITDSASPEVASTSEAAAPRNVSAASCSATPDAASASADGSASNAVSASGEPVASNDTSSSSDAGASIFNDAPASEGAAASSDASVPGVFSVSPGTATATSKGAPVPDEGPPSSCASASGSTPTSALPSAPNRRTAFASSVSRGLSVASAWGRAMPFAEESASTGGLAAVMAAPSPALLLTVLGAPRPAPSSRTGSGLASCEEASLASVPTSVALLIVMPLARTTDNESALLNPAPPSTLSALITPGAGSDTSLGPVLPASVLRCSSMSPPTVASVLLVASSPWPSLELSPSPVPLAASAAACGASSPPSWAAPMSPSAACSACAVATPIAVSTLVPASEETALLSSARAMPSRPASFAYVCCSGFPTLPPAGDFRLGGSPASTRATTGGICPCGRPPRPAGA